jgi:hypothetical protein
MSGQVTTAEDLPLLRVRLYFVSLVGRFRGCERWYGARLLHALQALSQDGVEKSGS